VNKKDAAAKKKRKKQNSEEKKYQAGKDSKKITPGSTTIQNSWRGKGEESENLSEGF
jgi:hypothetical protein